MEKIITLNNKIGTALRSILLVNSDAGFYLNINKELLSKWARRIGITALTIGYIAITMMSYSISPVYFWTLIKAGTILSLLFIIALSKK
jgi:hypothetical protein